MSDFRCNGRCNETRTNNNNNNNSKETYPLHHQQNHDGRHGRRRRPNHQSSTNSSDSKPTTTTNSRKKILLILHGNRQTGQLLLGRLDRLVKRLRSDIPDLELFAVDAPHSCIDEEVQSAQHHDNGNDTSDNERLLLTWWHRDGNDCIGLEESLEKLQVETATFSLDVFGFLGFSQGARLVHLLTLLHSKKDSTIQWFPNLQFVIMVAGYDAPLPPQIVPLLGSDQDSGIVLNMPSLHVWGLNDPLIRPEQSEAVTRLYHRPQTMVHEGKHFVPTKAADIDRYIDFIQSSMTAKGSKVTDAVVESEMDYSTSSAPNVLAMPFVDHVPSPDDEARALQQEEVQALEAIFPDEIMVQSFRRVDSTTDEEHFDFPIVYHFLLIPSEESDNANKTGSWPPQPLTLRIQYPHNYPLETIPLYTLLHENTVFQFPSHRVDGLLNSIKETATAELGMPSVLSSIYAAKDFLDATPLDVNEGLTNGSQISETVQGDDTTLDASSTLDCHDSTLFSTRHPLVLSSTRAEIERGNLEGLEIAQALLQSSKDGISAKLCYHSKGGGGSFGTYTIGLVGKPSAGKSTFFNAATAFSRQRGQQQQIGGREGDPSAEWCGSGATMAAHPFTTIDPNIGFCLVPAPMGTCPEDDASLDERPMFGSTHGRDPNGRRFLPVLLKDVAGLVPGAYQGKGRGNQFLNDLTDATVLIHVADVSGSADASGNNIVVSNDDEDDEQNFRLNNQQYSNPIDDLAWIRRELVEWVYSNLMAKWDVVARKGRSKLAGMFSGYGQREGMTETVFAALEAFLEERYHRDKALEKTTTWNECDVHRLVSLFLGVRFPMAIALNKYDLPTAKVFVDEIQEALPIHGAHVGVPLSARSEMMFVRKQIMSNSKMEGRVSPPLGVWECLTSAVKLREPVLVFPVSDLTTLASMPGLNKVAVESPSLPSKGMIQCIKASGGYPPTCWNPSKQNYELPAKTRDNAETLVVSQHNKLRDVLLMKPGSTVEDVFLALKRLGAISGEFVRAEAFSGNKDDKPKPVPKTEMMNRMNCVIKIMSNKRTAWQNSKLL